MATKRTIAPKKPARHFAEGGIVGADGMTDAQRAKRNAALSNLGMSTAPVAQAAPPVVQPTPQPLPQQQGITAGIVGILKGRQQQIDKAAGYATGGIIRGPGTAKSDSIPATVRETGEEIRVSTGERVVSAAQGKFLESVAKNAGYKSLNAMLEDGTGKPVGPTIKAGKRAAADGLAPELDPFAYRGQKPEEPKRSSIATMPTLYAQPISGSAAGAPTGPGAGITVAPFGPTKPRLGSGVTSLDMPVASFRTTPATGRDASGSITAESAKGTLEAPMQRSGGIFGTYDGKGVNDILARENKARGEMIDLMANANGPAGAGFAALPDQAQEINMNNVLNKLAPEDRAKYELGRMARDGSMANLAARQGITERGQDLRSERDAARTDLLMRGQDLSLQRAADRNDVMMRGQDLRAETTDKRTTAITDRRGLPTLGQERGNAEIDASRERIAGLTPDEIKRKTANYTATGRENPEYDPTLAKAAALANRRKVGADDYFDQHQQPAGNDGDTMTRFRADQAMQGHKLGKQTDQGTEVFDSNGRLIGHYR